MQKLAETLREEKLALLDVPHADGFLIQRDLRLCREACVGTADPAGLRNGPAHPEDNAIFKGFEAGGIEGIIPTAAHPTRTIPDDYADYPSVVVDAAETLRRAEDYTC